MMANHIRWFDAELSRRRAVTASDENGDFPMFDGKNAIGVLTVGVKTERVPPVK